MRAGLTHRRAIIVGAGQSGLAVAAALAAEGLRPAADGGPADDQQQKENPS